MHTPVLQTELYTFPFSIIKEIKHFLVMTLLILTIISWLSIDIAIMGALMLVTF